MAGSAASAAYLPSSMIPAAFQDSSTQKARRSGLIRTSDRLTLGERDLPEKTSDLLPLPLTETTECGPGEEALLA